MWIIYSLLAAFFAGITTVFAKMGVNQIDTKLATALRTTVILLFSIIVVLFTDSLKQITNLNTKTIIYLVLCGITTALLWLSYFKALSLGNINKVTPVDKTSILVTLILSAIFLGEKITIIKIISMIFIILGTFLMTYKTAETENNKWLLYAIYTAIFTSLATILGKIGLNEIDSNLGNMIRTMLVFFIIWIVVFFNYKKRKIMKIDKRSWLSIIASGLTTGISWLCYFKALQFGEASMVFPIEKLSIVIAILFSTFILKEKLTKKSIFGLIIISLGIVVLII